MSHPAPSRPGHYWGRWHTPCEGTADDGEMCDPTKWEVHQVWRNGFGLSADDLLVFVPGVENPQPLDAFEWGPRIPSFQPETAS